MLCHMTLEWYRYTFLWIWNCLRTGMILPNGFSFKLWSWETVSCLYIFFYLLQRSTICENCFFMWFSIIHKKVSFLTPFWEENIHIEITYTLLVCNLKRKYKERTEGLNLNWKLSWDNGICKTISRNCVVKYIITTMKVE